ncbi:MAG: DUF2189 domain-containing protein [Georgfuchsia sp.]
MDDLPPQESDSPSPFPKLRDIDASRPFLWLSLAVGDMRAHPGPSLFYGCCFALLGFVTTWVFRNAYPYLSAVICGSLLLGPVLCMGLYEISRLHEQRQACHLLSTLAVWRRNLGNIGILAVVLGIAFLVWARASMVIFALFYESAIPTLNVFLVQVVSLDNLRFLAIYCVVALLFLSIAFAISVVSIQLMLDRNQDAITAVIASVATLLRNPVSMLIWALIIFFMTIAGFATFNLGHIVLMPLVGHAAWHAYRDAIEPPAC